MKNLVLLASISLLLGACNNVEKKAGELLSQAHEMYEQGNYNGARLLIDSIKTTYPKAFETREKSQKLMGDIIMKEQDKTLAYIDEEMKKNEDTVNEIKNQFVFEKNEKYQTVGMYLFPNQVIEKRIHQTYLKFQTDEAGKLFLTSVFCGPQYIRHTHVRATVKDGTFMDTPAPRDTYTTTDLGKKIENVSFKLDKEDNFIAFLYSHRDEPITIELSGEKNYKYTLSKADITAAVKIYQLSQALSAIEQLKKEKAEALRKLNFVKQKMEDREQEMDE